MILEIEPHAVHGLCEYGILVGGPVTPLAVHAIVSALRNVDPKHPITREEVDIRAMRNNCTPLCLNELVGEDLAGCEPAVIDELEETLMEGGVPFDVEYGIEDGTRWVRVFRPGFKPQEHQLDESAAVVIKVATLMSLLDTVGKGSGLSVAHALNLIRREFTLIDCHPLQPFTTAALASA